MTKIIFRENPKAEDVQILTRGLAAHAKLMKDQKPIEDFAVFLYDDGDKIVGGCSGIMYFGCLYIEQMWLDESYRAHDYGSKLIMEAEKTAKSKGCVFTTTDTMDWQALGFYKKLGYVIEFERTGYLHDSSQFMLYKKL